MLFTMPNEGTMGRLWWAALVAAGTTATVFKVPKVAFEYFHGSMSVAVPVAATLVFLWRFCHADYQMSLTRAKGKLPESAPLNAICKNKVLADVLFLGGAIVYGWIRFLELAEPGRLQVFVWVLGLTSFVIRFSNSGKIRSARKFTSPKSPPLQ